MLARVEQALGRAPTSLTADAGHLSQENLRTCLHTGTTPYFVVERERRRWPPPSVQDGAPPRDADTKTWMRWLLKSREGRTKMRRRKSTVELVFGCIKHARGFRQFLLRASGRSWASGRSCASPRTSGSSTPPERSGCPRHRTRPLHANHQRHPRFPAGRVPYGLLRAVFGAVPPAFGRRQAKRLASAPTRARVSDGEAADRPGRRRSAVMSVESDEESGRHVTAFGDRQDATDFHVPVVVDLKILCGSRVVGHNRPALVEGVVAMEQEPEKRAPTEPERRRLVTVVFALESAGPVVPVILVVVPTVSVVANQIYSKLDNLGKACEILCTKLAGWQCSAGHGGTQW